MRRSYGESAAAWAKAEPLLSELHMVCQHYSPMPDSPEGMFLR